MSINKGDGFSLKSMSNEELDRRGKRLFNDDDFTVLDKQNDSSDNNGSDSELDQETTIGSMDMEKKMRRIAGLDRGQASFEIEDLKNRVDKVQREDGMPMTDDQRLKAGYGKEWLDENFLRRKIMESNPNYQFIRAVSGHLSAPVEILFSADDLDDRVRRELYIRKKQDIKLQESKMTLQQLREEKKIHQQQLADRKMKRSKIHSEITEIETIKAYFINSLNIFYNLKKDTFFLSKFINIINRYDGNGMASYQEIRGVGYEFIAPLFIREYDSIVSGSDNNNRNGVTYTSDTLSDLFTIVKHFVELDRDESIIENDDSDEGESDIVPNDLGEDIDPDFLKRFMKSRFDQSIQAFFANVLQFMDQNARDLVSFNLFTERLASMTEDVPRFKRELNTVIYFNFFIYKIIDKIIHTYGQAFEQDNERDRLLNYQFSLRQQEENAFVKNFINDARNNRVDAGNILSRYLTENMNIKLRELQERKKAALIQLPRLIIFLCKKNLLLTVLEPPYPFKSNLVEKEKKIADSRYKFIRDELSNKNEATIARDYLKIDVETLYQFVRMGIKYGLITDIRSHVIYFHTYDSSIGSKTTSEVLEDIYKHFNGIELDVNVEKEYKPQLQEIFETSKLKDIKQHLSEDPDAGESINQKTLEDTSSSYSIFPLLLNQIAYWNSLKMRDNKKSVKKINDDINKIDEKLAKFGTVSFDDSDQIEYPYKHRASYALSPENSGHISVIPALTAGIEQAYNLVNLYLENLKGVPITVLQDNPDIRYDFAELVQLCMDKKSQIHPKFIRGQNERKEIALQRKDVMTRLSRYTVRRTMGFSGEYTYEISLPSINGYKGNYRPFQSVLRDSERTEYKSKRSIDKHIQGKAFM